MDLEDGEVSGSGSGSGSDSDPGRAALPLQQPRGSAPLGCPALRPPAAAYRSSVRAAASSSSDSDSAQEEEAALWRRKRLKASGAPQPPASLSARVAPGGPGARKVNNIWGSVVQEQSQDAVAAVLGVFGMEGDLELSSRSVESYNYIRARRLMDQEREQEEAARGQQEVSMLNAQLEEYMKGRGPEEEGQRRSEGKRPPKERLGPRAEMDVQGRFEIGEDDPEERVAEEIAHRLREPKADLIGRVVGVVGRRAALELLERTAALERCGGVPTLDGSRRRTPGGVYLHLLKTTPGITRQQLRRVFLDETRRDTASRKAAQKRRRHLVAKKMKQAIGTLDLKEHDDGSRETFASDTNEALGDVEEEEEEEEGRRRRRRRRGGGGGGEEEEEEEDEEHEEENNVGAEDGAVVYTSTDLEVF